MQNTLPGNLNTFDTILDKDANINEMVAWAEKYILHG